MSLSTLIQDFEIAKQNVEPIVKKRRIVLPIFRVKPEGDKIFIDGHLVGDGFFYSSPNQLDWKYGGTGHSQDATPQNLLESYQHYKKRDITMEEALIEATQILNEYYIRLRPNNFSISLE